LGRRKKGKSVHICMVSISRHKTTGNRRRREGNSITKFVEPSFPCVLPVQAVRFIYSKTFTPIQSGCPQKSPTDQASRPRSTPPIWGLFCPSLDQCDQDSVITWKNLDCLRSRVGECISGRVLGRAARQGRSTLINGINSSEVRVHGEEIRRR